MALSITTFSKMTLTTLDLISTLSLNDIEHSNTQLKHSVSLCSVSNFDIVMISVVILSVIMLNVVLLNVVAPLKFF